MKCNQKGFIIPVLIAIIAVLAIGGGIYIFKLKSSQEAISQAVNTVSTSDNSNQIQSVSSVTSLPAQANKITFTHPTGLY